MYCDLTDNNMLLQILLEMSKSIYFITRKRFWTIPQKVVLAQNNFEQIEVKNLLISMGHLLQKKILSNEIKIKESTFK